MCSDSQVIAQRYMQGTVEIQGGRAVLIEYFKTRGFGEDRTCFELPYQMRLANQLADLEATIKVGTPSRRQFFL